MYWYWGSLKNEIIVDELYYLLERCTIKFYERISCGIE